MESSDEAANYVLRCKFHCNIGMQAIWQRYYNCVGEPRLLQSINTREIT